MPGMLIIMQLIYYNRCNDKENKEFYSERKDLLSSKKPLLNWVTVFGFSLANKEEILSKFTQMPSCCDVRETGQNWAHICFNDQTDYHRALLFNGHVTNNGTMIGVIQCNDKV